MVTMSKTIFFLTLFVGCLSLAKGQSSSIINGTDANETAPTESSAPYVYWLYTSSETCIGEGSSIVGVRGFVTLEDFAVTGGSTIAGNTSAVCARDMACLFDASSTACQDLEASRVATGYDAVLDDGSIYECDSTNPLTGEDV